MPDNSMIILADVLEQQRAQLSPESSPQDYFEIFCAEQILKDFNLSYDELAAGIVDGEHDGGVDSVYAFVNGELVQEDFDSTRYRTGVEIELHMIQSKTAAGFSESTLNRLISLTRHLLSLSQNYSELSQYNESVKTILDTFREAYRELASTFPTLSIYYHYAAQRGPETISPNLRLKSDELKQIATSHFPDADVTVNLLGSRRLLELARMQPRTTHNLRVSKNLSAEDAYIGLTSLAEYVCFLKDANGAIQADLFESNVRDFQGNTEVNAEIKNTLQGEHNVDFWWMNNGVTIIARQATLNGDIVTMENPQIVNGLQTSNQIAQHFQPTSTDTRSIMVKIISSENEETRDKIIKATNRQNSIQPASLRATDKVQRDIEDALQTVGLFYDRRKNYYKNQGKPVSKIISIPLMAQSLMTIVLNKPDYARARPGSLIKQDKDYSQLFSESFPIALYINAAVLIRRVESVLKSRSEMTAKDRNNIRFYVLVWLTAVLTGHSHPSKQAIANIDMTTVNDDEIELAVNNVWELYETRGKTDQDAKSAELREAILKRVKAKLE